MGDIADNFAETFRDYATAGVASTGPHEPSKAAIRALGPSIERSLGAQLGAVSVVKTTQALLNADLAHDADTLALVYADADEAKIDLYVKTGASGAGAWTNTGALHATLDAFTGAIDQRVTSTLEIAEQGFSKAVTVGGWTGTGTETLPGLIFGVGFHFRQRALLVGAKIECEGAGTLSIARALQTNDGDTHLQIGDSATVAHADGTLTLDYEDILAANGGAPLIFEPGEIPTIGSSAALRYGETAEPAWTFPGGLTEFASPPTLNLTADDNTGGISVDAELYFMAAPPADPLALATLEDMREFTVVPSTFENAAGAIPTGTGALFLGDTAFGVSLWSRRAYGLERITYEADVKVSAASHVVIATHPRKPVDSAQYEGSFFVHEVENDQIVPYKRYDGLVVPAADAAVPLTNPDGSTPAIATDHVYTYRWSKDGRDQVIEFIDPTGVTAFSHRVEWHNGADKAMDGYTTTFIDKTKYGLMHGGFGIQDVNAGAGLVLTGLRITAPYRQFCDLLIVSDSIDEGFGVFEGERAVDALALRLGAENVVVSAVGGRNSRGMLNSLAVLLDTFKPRIVLLPIGTNGGDGGDYVANMAIAVKMVRSVGARVIVETIPTQAPRSTFLRGLAGVDDVIDIETAFYPGGVAYPTFYDLDYQDTGASYGAGSGDLTHLNAVGQARKDVARRRVTG